jgi:xylono-1,5-lactonase
MTTSPPELLSSGHGLLEAPVWHPVRGLLVADADVGGVWSFRPGTKPEAQIAHRRGIGGMALHETGGVVVSGRNIAAKAFIDQPDAEKTRVMLTNDPARGMIGFNDLTTDATGRIYVGSIGFKAMEHEDPNARSAFLHMIDLDGSSRIVADDVQLTNGLGFSPEGKLLYHSDSMRHIVKVYDVRDDGTLGSPEVFVTTPFGSPDGLAVAEDGSVWLAVAYGNAVSRFAADGQELERIIFPVPMVTSLCFGGEDLRDLYVVSGSRGAPPDLGACVYQLRSDVAGLPRAVARVPLPAQ